ncbi:MAG: chemotaxis protein CheY [Deltaproteobacteria bacterium SG8_13]|nr:MAG: chemotaxis protein CheY [Deltaproteobacteria bacterium SG8_13]
MEKKKVLVVDDEIDMRIYISTVLKTSGFEPVTTREGGEAIRKAKEIRPDLVVLDVMMPGEGGAETYRELKQDPDLQNIPVILVSAVKKDSFLHYLRMLNARLLDPIPPPFTYLEKPVEPEDLAEAAKAALAT